MLNFNGQVSLVGIVLQATPFSAPVSSDRAWIDTGDRLLVKYWDVKNRVVRSKTYYAEYGDSATVDASEEIRVAAKEYEIGRDWFFNTLKTCQQVKKLAKGSTVEVFKGRKVPKGIYTIVHLGEGNFGPFVDLKDNAGKLYRYVSEDNVRISNSSLPPYYEFFMRFQFINLDKLSQQFLIFADKLEEDDHPMSSIVRRMAAEYTQED